MSELRILICMFFINLGIRLMPKSWRTEQSIINLIIINRIKVKDDGTISALYNNVSK